MSKKQTVKGGLRVADINAGNIWVIQRGQLEALFLERERSRDVWIGMAFCLGSFVGAAFVAAMLVLWPTGGVS